MGRGFTVRRSAFTLVLVALAVLSVGLTSCSTGGAAPTAAPAPTTAAQPGPKANPKIALLLFSRGFEFMVALDQGAQSAAKKLGAEITVLDGQSDTQVQLRQIEDLLAKGIDAIVISPNNSEEIVPGIRKANQAGVPVVSVDAIVSSGAEVAGHVGFDNSAGGKIAAEYIAKQLGSGTVLELRGGLGAYHAQQRNRGFSEGMAAAPRFEVISKAAEWQADNAQTITADVATARSDVNAIFSHNDEMIRGVVSALKQVGKFKKVGEPGHIMIVGIDGTPLALERIRNGEQDATVQQDPFEMGATAVRTAIDALNGKEVPPQQLLPPTLVTKENVDTPTLWGNKFKP